MDRSSKYINNKNYNYFNINKWELIEGEDWFYAYRIVEALQKIVDGELRNDRGFIKNVIISIPPRFEKSESANIGFIALVLANNPKGELHRHK